MTAPLTLYFHAPALRQRFIDDLDEAVQAQRITPEERRWLLPLADPATYAPSASAAGAQPEKAPARVDRLLVEDGSSTRLALAATLLISAPDDAATPLYLSTLLDGVERFDTRASLLKALSTRFGDDPSRLPAYEYEKVDGDPFTHRSGAILDQQTRQLNEHIAQLQQLPLLRTALAEALGQQFKTLEPTAEIDIAHQRLQIKTTAVTASTPVAVKATPSLLDAAYEQLMGQSVPAGFTRHFLDADGAALDAAASARFTQALTDAVAAVPGGYPVLLDEYWQQPAHDAASRRVYFARALADVFQHELLRRRHDGTLSEAVFRRVRSMMLPVGAAVETGAAAKAQQLVLTLDGGKQLVPAGLFLIVDLEPGAPKLIMYSAQQGLRRSNELQGVIDHFSSAEGRLELLPYLSGDEHALLRASRSLSVTTQDIEPPLFDARIDSIIALQRRKLVFALSQTPQPRAQRTSDLDDALDVRPLLDSRLRAFGGGRWLSSIDASYDASDSASGSQPQESDPDPAQDAGSADSASITLAARMRVASPWIERLRVLDERARRVLEAHPGIESLARDALNAWLATLATTSLDSANITVHMRDERSPSAEKGWMPLIDLFLERLTGYRTAPLDDDAGVYLDLPGTGSPMLLSAVSASLIDSVLNTVAATFNSACTAGLASFFSGSGRQGSEQIFPEMLSIRVREGSLRLEHEVETRLAVIPADCLAQLAQVLDFPEHRQRAVHGAKRVEVHSLSISLADGKPPVAMTNAFVLRQPGDAKAPVGCWSAARGLRNFASIEALEQNVNQLRRRADWPLWLSLFDEQDRLRLMTHLGHSEDARMKLRLTLVEGHFVSHLQRVEQNRQAQSLASLQTFAKRCQFDGPMLRNAGAAAALEDINLRVLDELSVSLDGAVVEAMLPSWVKNSSSHELMQLCELARTSQRIMAREPDYLFDIPSLEDFASEKLRARLATDFPDQALGDALDPEQIRITFVHRIAAPVPMGDISSMLGAGADVHSATLTEFAITRFDGLKEGQLSATRLDDGPALPALSSPYLQTLVDTLDVGRAYLKLLEAKFAAKDPDYSARNAYFISLLPSMTLTAAFEQKLDGSLSEAAYRMIEAVFEMPDGLARLPVNAQSVLISPLKLVAQADSDPDVIPGFYVLCPTDPEKGPVVLHSIFNELFNFKEYASRAALLADIASDEALQKILLPRMSADAQKCYGHGGFVEPHIPWNTESSFDVSPDSPAPPTLKIDPVRGNALQFLFVDNLKLLESLTAQHVMTTEQSRQQTLLFFMALAVDQAVFIPGPVGKLASLLQGFNLLQASVSSASQQQWGKAVSELTLALGMLIAARGLSGVAPDDANSAAVEEEPSELEVRFSWTDTLLTAEQRVRLRALAVQDIALADLTRDKLLNLYADATAKKFYAAVAGKVYRLKATDEGWVVVGPNGDIGPSVSLDANLRWQFDLSPGLKGGGAAVTRFQNSQMDARIELFFHVEASGMPQIRRQFREKARAIGQAQLQAKTYLETALDNLAEIPGTPLHADAMRIVEDFFGVSPAGQPLLAQIRDSARKLYGEIMDASLSTTRSTRYVVGTNRTGYEKVCAFVVKGDTDKRIYLTERFFKIPNFALKARKPGDPAFNARDHYRAVNLIHELSHQVLDTRDIAYLEASAPFLDLLGEPDTEAVKVKAALVGWQDRALSHLSQRDTLFQLLDDERWRDLKHDDGGAKRSILKITDTLTLEEAREVFMTEPDKRSKLILANADSVALLMARLGRRNFVHP
jgi:hypothetical protein